jgi:hypothetical protein
MHAAIVDICIHNRMFEAMKQNIEKRINQQFLASENPPKAHPGWRVPVKWLAC